MADSAAGGSAPTRWVCLDGEGRRGAAVESARRAAQEARAQGLDVDLVVLPCAAGVPSWDGYDLLVALGEDPRKTSAWWPAATAGVPVLLPAVPGAIDVLREAVCLGAAATVLDPADPVAVLAAVRALAAAPEEHRRLAAAVLRRRQGGGEVDTRPRVLAVALDARGMKTALTTLRYVTELGGVCHLLVRRGVTRRGWREPVEAASVTYVDDPTVTSPPARAERLLLVRGPQLAAHVVPRVLGVVRLVAPCGSARVVDALDRTAGAAVGGWAAAGAAVHARAWSPVSARLRPWLVARRALRRGGSAGPWQGEDLDLVVAPGPDAQTLVWRLLRAHPRAASRGSITYQGVVEVVRRRARECVGD